jgi:hypothetical protein
VYHQALSERVTVVSSDLIPSQIGPTWFGLDDESSSVARSGISIESVCYIRQRQTWSAPILLGWKIAVRPRPVEVKPASGTSDDTVCNSNRKAQRGAWRAFRAIELH